MNNEPWFSCTGCYEDMSCRAKNLRVDPDGEAWCESCYDQRRDEQEGNPWPEWDELPVFVPESDKKIATLEAELERAIETLRIVDPQSETATFYQGPCNYVFYLCKEDIDRICGLVADYDARKAREREEPK